MRKGKKRPLGRLEILLIQFEQVAIDLVHTAILEILDLNHPKVMRLEHFIRSLPLVFKLAASTEFESYPIAQDKISLLELLPQNATIMNGLSLLFQDP